MNDAAKLRKAITVTLAVLFLFSPSYIADLGMRRLRLDIGIAAAAALLVFLIGLFMLIWISRE